MSISMNEKLRNLSEGIKELESMILLARQQGRSTAGNEILLEQLCMMKFELMEKVHAQEQDLEFHAQDGIMMM